MENRPRLLSTETVFAPNVMVKEVKKVQCRSVVLVREEEW